MYKANEATQGIYGVGLGLRAPHYAHILESRPPIPWFEVISENFMETAGGRGGRPIRLLEKFRELYPIALHGVSMSIGSADELDYNYLQRLGELIARIEPAIVSDHLSWSSVGGENLHDLLPFPYDEETLAHVTRKIERAQEFLGRQILIENPSAYLSFARSEIPEWEFLNALAAKTGCGILLDINNVYVSSVNLGFNAYTYLSGLRGDYVRQIHLAGHTDSGSVLIDTHDRAVTEAVWELYAASVEKLGPVPGMIEWDDRVPTFEVLASEAERARVIAASARVLPIQGEGPHARRQIAQS